MVDRLTGFFEWVMEAPLTVQQRADLRQDLVRAWQQGDQPEIDGMVQILEVEAQVAEHPAAERDFVREQLQPELLSELRKQPDDEGAKWLLGIYESAHAPIAGGDPPLTRQMADAYAEVLCFMIGQVMANGLEASAGLKDKFAAGLVADYPNYDAAARAQLGKMPVYWAAIRVAWPAFSAEEQEAYRKQWAAGVAALFPQQPDAVPAGAATLPADGRPALESEDAVGFLQRAVAELDATQYAWGGPECDWAIADCDRALELDPRLALAYATRGKALDHRSGPGDDDEALALQDYNRAIEIDPKCAAAYEGRGTLYYNSHPDLAEQDWATMRKLKGESEVQTTGDARLDAMRRLQEHQETMKWASNMSMMSHEANMAVISNLGSGWTYEYRY